MIVKKIAFFYTKVNNSNVNNFNLTTFVYNFTNMKELVYLFFKGVAMGAANVIPGVSGGTVALITGIFEKLIDSIKSINLKAIKLLFTGKFTEFANHINLKFLFMIFFGVGASIFSLAKILDFLFVNYPIYIWSYFFGLIIASVYFVAKTIEKWNSSVILSFIIGTAVAITITFLTPANENDSTIYIFICGIVAVMSMILPGLSGSFILILMGNYQLVMIDAVSELNIKILLPLMVGAGFGLIAFSHILSWIFKKFKNQTIAVLSGFILGSLGILWPWKEELTQSFGEKTKVIGYNWNMPESFNTEVIIAIAMLIIGYFTILGMEKIAGNKK